MGSLKKIVLSVLVLYISIYEVSGIIECHYCGIRKLCSLPYDDTLAEKISCAKSCMKFDGQAEDGKRVLVRSCGVEDTNICNKTTTWHGSKGEKCICNAANCNGATKTYETICSIIPTIAFLLIFMITHQYR